MKFLPQGKQTFSVLLLYNSKQKHNMGFSLIYLAAVSAMYLWRAVVSAQRLKFTPNVQEEEIHEGSEYICVK